MLAAIGLILILKQLPHLVGHDANPLGTMSFEEPDHENTFSAIWHLFRDIHPGSLVIGLISLLILQVWDKVKWLKNSFVPAPLVVVLAGVGLVAMLAGQSGRWPVTATHLVQVPVADSVAGILAFLRWPDVSAITNPTCWHPP